MCEDDAAARGSENVRNTERMFQMRRARAAGAAIRSTARIADSVMLGYGAAVVAFHRNTTDAVVVWSVFLNPGTGSFE